MISPHAPSIREQQVAVSELRSRRLKKELSAGPIAAAKSPEAARMSGSSSTIGVGHAVEGVNPASTDKGYRKRLTIDVSSNYKAMLELFDPQGSLLSNTEQEVTIPFELFEAVQSRQKSFRDELMVTQQVLTATTESNKLLKRESVKCQERMQKIEDENRSLLQRVEQLTAFNREIGARRDEADKIAEVSQAEAKQATDSVQKLTQQLNDALSRLVATEETLLVKQTALSGLLAEKEALCQELEKAQERYAQSIRRSMRTNISMMRARNQTTTNQPQGSSRSPLLISLPMEESAEVGCGLEAESSASPRNQQQSNELHAMLVTADGNRKRQTSVLVDRLAAVERQLMEVEDERSVCATAAAWKRRVARDSVKVEQVRIEAEQEKNNFFKSMICPFMEDSPFHGIWESFLDAGSMAESGMTQTLRTFERFEVVLKESLSLKELIERWVSFSGKWRGNCTATMRASLTALQECFEQVGRIDGQRQEKLKSDMAAFEKRFEKFTFNASVQTVPATTRHFGTDPPPAPAPDKVQTAKEVTQLLERLREAESRCDLLNAESTDWHRLLTTISKHVQHQSRWSQRGASGGRRKPADPISAAESDGARRSSDAGSLAASDIAAHDRTESPLTAAQFAAGVGGKSPFVGNDVLLGAPSSHRGRDRPSFLLSETEEPSSGTSATQRPLVITKVPDWVNQLMVDPQKLEAEGSSGLFMLLPEKYFEFHNRLMEFLQVVRRRFRVSFPVADSAAALHTDQKTIADVHLILKLDFDAIDALMAVCTATAATTAEASKKMIIYKEKVDKLRLHMLDTNTGTNIKSLSMMQRQELMKYRTERLKAEMALAAVLPPSLATDAAAAAFSDAALMAAMGMLPPEVRPSVSGRATPSLSGIRSGASPSTAAIFRTPGVAPLFLDAMLPAGGPTAPPAAGWSPSTRALRPPVQLPAAPPIQPLGSDSRLAAGNSLSASSGAVQVRATGGKSPAATTLPPLLLAVPSSASARGPAIPSVSLASVPESSRSHNDIVVAGRTTRTTRNPRGWLPEMVAPASQVRNKLPKTDSFGFSVTGRAGGKR